MIVYANISKKNHPEVDSRAKGCVVVFLVTNCQPFSLAQREVAHVITRDPMLSDKKIFLHCDKHII